MPRARRRKSVVSDPDRTPRPGRDSAPERGIAVNTGTDPQRPGATPRPVPDPAPPGTTAEETSVPAGRFDATREPEKSGRAEDVEGTKRDPSDAL